MAKPKTMATFAEDAAGALRHLSGSSDALAFIANQIEIAAIESSRAARAAEITARAAEANAAASLMALATDRLPTQPCEFCGTHNYLWQSMCLGCGEGFGSDAQPKAAL